MEKRSEKLFNVAGSVVRAKLMRRLDVELAIADERGQHEAR
jgi:hypothetical protein